MVVKLHKFDLIAKESTAYINAIVYKHLNLTSQVAAARVQVLVALVTVVASYIIMFKYIRW